MKCKYEIYGCGGHYTRGVAGTTLVVWRALHSWWGRRHTGWGWCVVATTLGCGGHYTRGVAVRVIRARGVRPSRA